ncbi:MAG: hypothetical protein HY427_02575 [Candidatus Levybacteria bacterium]|nr:hypothetical protein [Candidatus Levybacteria bacterium]
MRVEIESGKTPVEVCLDILDGKFSDLSKGPVHDDRREQMSACLFLGQNARPDDERVLNALLLKLRDDRAVNEYVSLNEGYVGSDFYIPACAAEALVSLNYANSVKEVYKRAKSEGHMPQDAKENENYRELWQPDKLNVKGDVLESSSDLLWSII